MPNRHKASNILFRSLSPDWDRQTLDAVRYRVEEVPPIRFFTARETEILQALADRIIPQPKNLDQKIPVVPWIDEKLYFDQRSGYRYEGMPPQRKAWRLGLSGIEETAHSMFGSTFSQLPAEKQDEVLRRIQHGDPPGNAWIGLPSAIFFKQILCSEIVKIYYSHPFAWNEIGYSGPAAIRGHVRIWQGGVDPWNAKGR